MGSDEDQEYESLWEALGKVSVVIWFCPARREHGKQVDKHGWLLPTVEWVDGVAHCLHPGCGKKSTDKKEES